MTKGDAAMDYRFATDADISLLAEWNHQLIRDEGHRNPMTVPQLADRMRGWLAGDYRAVLFTDSDDVADAAGSVGATDPEDKGGHAVADVTGVAAAVSPNDADISASPSDTAEPTLRSPFEGGGHARLRPGHTETPPLAWPGDVLHPIPAPAPAAVPASRPALRGDAYALYRETDDEIYLRQFFVARDRRRAGIGRRAIALLHTCIWPTNKHFTLDVLVGNTAGIAFWRAVGYRDYCLRMEMRQCRP